MTSSERNTDASRDFVADNNALQHGLAGGADVLASGNRGCPGRYMASLKLSSISAA